MARNQLNVLLVEDNPGDARLVKEMLSEAPYPTFKLSHVRDFTVAMERLSRERFDALVLDLSLADSPRLGTLLEIHEQARKLPVVVLTGMDDQAVENWALREGAHDYLVKGQVDAAALVQSITFAIDLHSERACRAPGRTDQVPAMGSP